MIKDDRKVKSVKRCSLDCPHLAITKFCRKYRQILEFDGNDFIRCALCKEEKEKSEESHQSRSSEPASMRLLQTEPIDYVSRGSL